MTDNEIINRQKAEIDRLTEHNNLLMQRIENLVYECDCAEQKAVKEFAKRLKNECAKDGAFGYVDAYTIDNIAKEIEGDNNG